MSVKKRTIKRKSKKTRRNISYRVSSMHEDPESVWGKNPSLEKFWRDLASGKNVVVIYKNGKHKYVTLPNEGTEKYITIFDEFDDNKEIAAVLSSNMSQDAYEVYLYPKAKENNVDYVIKNYKKYFKPFGGMSVPPLMKKVRFPN